MFKQLKKAIKKIDGSYKSEVCSNITSLIKDAYITGCVTAENDEPKLSLLMAHFIADMQDWLRLSGYKDSQFDFTQNPTYPDYIKKYVLPKSMDEMDHYTERYFIKNQPIILAQTEEPDTKLLETNA